MASRAKQLAALQIQEAEAKRKASKSQLVNAILEGKPVDVTAALKALLESASANLTGLQRKE